MWARDRVLVTGLGPVGQAASLLASRLGCRVVGAYIPEDRCVGARGLGVVVSVLVCVRVGCWLRGRRDHVVLGKG